MDNPERRYCVEMPSLTGPDDVVTWPVRDSGQLHAAFLKTKLWRPIGTEIDIHFLNGTAAQRRDVETHAREWLRHVNLKFNFNGGPSSPVRIAFNPGDGSWSYIGTDANGVPASRPTMNFGWIDRSTVLHEFGHMLGMVHEHQNPTSNPLVWNRNAVIQDLSASQGWTVREIEHNVLNRYDHWQVNASTFDSASIMLYFIPQHWLMSGGPYFGSTSLSPLDIRFASLCYPMSAWALRSAEYARNYLRVDGRGVERFAPHGAGIVNCQFDKFSFEQIDIHVLGGGKFAIGSTQFLGAFLRIDGSSVGGFAHHGAGIVNCQASIGPWEEFRIEPQAGGAVAIASVAFPNVYLRMAGNLTSFAPHGAGTVNCQYGVGPLERFLIERHS